jgi:hypothetical protein
VAIRADVETVLAAYEKITTNWKYGLNYAEFREWLRSARIAADELKQKRDITLVRLLAADLSLGAADSAWRMKISGVTSLVYEKPYPTVTQEFWWPRGGEFSTREDAVMIAMVGAFIDGDEELKKIRQRGGNEVEPMDVIQRAMASASESVAEERKWLDKR